MIRSVKGLTVRLNMYKCLAPHNILPIPTAREEEEEINFRLPHCVVHPTGLVLGKGSFGEVVEVRYNFREYAAKKLHKKDANDNFTREIEIMSRIKHHNIVRYYGLCNLAKTQELVIVMEKVERSLHMFLKSKVDITLSIKLQILLDVVRGVRYLHNEKPAIVHRDLTADNILVDGESTAKICDFGNSIAVNLKEAKLIPISNHGTIDYMAPEALDGGEYDEKVDIFAFGHLAIHVINQRRPFPLLHHSYRVAGQLIARTEVQRRWDYLQEMRHELEKEDITGLYHVVTQCLQEVPEERPFCQVIMSGLVANSDPSAIGELQKFYSSSYVNFLFSFSGRLSFKCISSPYWSCTWSRSIW